MSVVLVHGSYFGAWCWELVASELGRLGHRTNAVDLPISERGLGAAAYAEAVIAQAEWDEEPVLVAHSMSGLVVPLVAAARPVRRMIFIAAFLAKPGMSAMDQRAAEPIDAPTPPATSEWTDLGGDLWTIGPNTARELFMHDATADIAREAIARLRPQCYVVMSEVTPLAAWPDVPSDYLVCADDRALNPEWGRRAARERLGVEPVEVEGDHSPMLSRPTALAAIIDRLARQ